MVARQSKLFVVADINGLNLRSMGRLFWKIFFGFWITLIAIALGVGITVHWNAQQKAEEGADFINKQGIGFMLHAASNALQQGGEQQLQVLLSEWQITGPPPFLIVNEQNQELYRRPLPRRWRHRMDRIWQQPNLPPHLRRVRSPSGEQYLIVMVPRAALTHLPQRQFHWSHGTDRVRLRLWITLVGSILFSAALAWTITSPVRELQKTVKAFASGELNARSSKKLTKRRDELGDLHREFNSMASSIQQLMETQNHLFHDVSHEIRSPLTRLSVALGLIGQSPNKQGSLLVRMQQEIDRLDELVEEIFSLSRLSSGMVPSPFVSIDLAALLEDLIQEYQFDAQQMDKQLVYRPQQSVRIEGDAILLQRAFGNLIQNALRYTPKGSSVQIGLEKSADEQVIVTVTDEGPGVPDEELDALFQPFYRGRSSKDGEGFGLGLAVTQRSIQIHNGLMKAENMSSGGLRIKVMIPISKT